MENSLSNFYLSFPLTIYQYVYVLVYTLIILVFFAISYKLVCYEQYNVYNIWFWKKTRKYKVS